MNRWPLYKAHFWEATPFFRLLLPFASGIICYYALVQHHYLLLILAILISTFIISIPLVFQQTNATKRIALFIVLHILLLGSGYMVSYLTDSSNNPNWYGSALNTKATYMACITATPAARQNSWKIPVSVIRTISNKGISTTEGEGIVYIYKDVQPMLYHKGDTLLLPGNWQPVKNAGNPFEFDIAGYQKRNNIYYQQFCSAKAVRLFALANAAPPITERIHDWCMLQLDRYITDPKTKGLIQAMLLGDEVNLDDELRQSFTDTGIVHVIAISGGNVMLFFTCISILLWWIKDKKYDWVKYLTALPLVWFYVLMAGASPSAVRAALMFSLLALGILLNKNNNSLNQLLATAFVLLCAQPVWLFATGFQLSFVAVLSLILFYKPIYKLITIHKGPKWRVWIKVKIWETIAASLAAEILTAPLVVFCFHNFPVMFLIANVLAFAFMFVVLVAGIIIIVLSKITFVAAAIGTITTALVQCFNWLMKLLQLFNPQSFHFLLISLPELILLYLLITGTAIFLLRKQKAGLFIALSSCSILLFLLSANKWQTLQQKRLIVYNTPKTNHIELITADHYAVLNPDTTADSKFTYATTPAHIAWQAWKRNNDTQLTTLHINGKNILILNDTLHTAALFPADYVIVNYKGTIDPEKIAAVCHPALIIIGNNYNRTEQATWALKAQSQNIALHIVSRNGAWGLGE